MTEVLQFTQQQEFERVINLYQSGNGSLYYLVRGRPQKLYAIAEDSTETVAYSPAEINFVERIDNEIYFQTEENKIYRAQFQPPAGMATKYLRQIGEIIEENETRERGVMISRVIDGKKYVYRLCDAPEKGVLIDATTEQLEGLRLKAVHRGKLIYERTTKQDAPSIEKLTENIILIGSVFPGYEFGFTDDSTPLIYNMITPTLEVYNTETMEVEAVGTDLPKAYFRVVGVHEGKITVQAGGIVFTAQLPERLVV